MAVRRSPGALDARVDGALIVLNPTTSEFVEFNEVAAAVWDALGDGPADVDALAAEVVADYDVSPEHGRASIKMFVQRAVVAGLIENV